MDPRLGERIKLINLTAEILLLPHLLTEEQLIQGLQGIEWVIFGAGHLAKRCMAQIFCILAAFEMSRRIRNGVFPCGRGRSSAHPPRSEGGLDRLQARVPRKVGCQGRSRFSGAFGTLDSPPFSEKQAWQAIKAGPCRFDLCFASPCTLIPTQAASLPSVSCTTQERRPQTAMAPRPSATSPLRSVKITHSIP